MKARSYLVVFTVFRIVALFPTTIDAQSPDAQGSAETLSSADATKQQLQFDVASIRLSKTQDGVPIVRPEASGIRATDCPLPVLIGFAYGPIQLGENGVLGLPKWAKSQHYDVTARVSGTDAVSLAKLSPDDRVQLLSQMLRPILADRFGLQVHSKSVPNPNYRLVVAKRGARLKESTTHDPAFPNGSLRVTKRRLVGKDISVAKLAGALSGQLNIMVVDETGLKGTYDISLDWNADLTPSNEDGGLTPIADLPDQQLLSAVEQELGLHLEKVKGTTEVVVVDNVHQPSSN